MIYFYICRRVIGTNLRNYIKDIKSVVSNIFELGVNTHSLETYQKERKSDNNAMIEITDTINTVFSNNSQIFHLARQFSFKAIEKISPLKKLLIKYAMGQRK